MLFGKGLENYDSEEDQSYQPELLDEELPTKVRRREDFDPKRELAQLNLQLKQSKPKAVCHDPLALARKVLSLDSCKISKVVIFAGKQFFVNSEGEMVEQQAEKDKAGQNLTAEEKWRLSFAKANHLINKLIAGSKKINSVAKSKFDWQQYIKKEKIEDKLAFNRKGGKVIDLIKTQR